MLNPLSFGTAVIALAGVVWTYLDSRHRRRKQNATILRLANQVDELTARLEHTKSESLLEFLQQQTGGLKTLEENVISLEESTSRRFSDQQHAIDHLLGEEQNLCMLPRWNPDRRRLLDHLLPKMQPLIETLVPVLFPTQFPLDDWDWMYRLPEKKFPYSLTFEEGMLIYFLIRECGLKEGYEIATAFGFSGSFIGKALHENGGRLLSVDAYIEEDQEDFLYSLDATRRHVASVRSLIETEERSAWPLGLQWATKAAETLGIRDSIDFRAGCSPDDVDELVQGRTFDFAFIDGGHFGEQPVKDFDSVLPFLDSERFLIVFHDTQCEAVAKGVHHAAQRTGCEPFSIHTRNRLVVLGRGLDPNLFQRCRAMTLRQFA
ncbi:MAG: class I SAM-dependent methyltransferase [Planctomycetota bacterium]